MAASEQHAHLFPEVSSISAWMARCVVNCPAPSDPREADLPSTLLQLPGRRAFPSLWLFPYSTVYVFSDHKNKLLQKKLQSVEKDKNIFK